MLVILKQIFLEKNRLNIRPINYNGYYIIFCSWLKTKNKVKTKKLQGPVAQLVRAVHS